MVIDRILNSLWISPVFVIVLGLSGAIGEDAIRRFNIPAQPLGRALLEFSLQSNKVVYAPQALVDGKESPTVVGEMSASAALQRLLDGSGLASSEGNNGQIAIVLAQNDVSNGASPGREAQRTRLAQIGQNDASSNALGSAGEADVSGRPKKVSEIVVTARKRGEEYLFDVPMSIAAVTGTELDQRGADDILNLSYFVPGLSAISSGPGQQQFQIRGISDAAGLATVGYYLDEASVSTSAQQQIDIRNLDISRVEVLRGPQGTLYGEGSMGGTIRFITNQPVLDDYQAELQGSVYATKNGDESFQFKGMVNIPLVEDKLGIRAAVLYEDLGGYVDNIGTGVKDFNDNEAIIARAKILFQPIDRLSITGTIQISNIEGGGFNQVIEGSLDFSTPFPTPFEDDYNFYNVTVDWDLGFGTLTSSSAYLDKRQLSNFSDDITPGVVNIVKVGIDQEIFTQEVRFNSDFDGPFNFTLGFFYRDSESPIKVTLDSTAIFPPGPPLFLPIEAIVQGDIFAEFESQSIAFFGEASWDITTDLVATVGLRYFEDDQAVLRDDETVVTTILGSFPPIIDNIVTFFSEEDTFNSWNPRFNLSYKVTDSILTYVNVAKGFRSGGFNTETVFSDPFGGAPFIAPSSFEPDFVWTYEGGVKATAFGEKLTFETAVFYSDWNNVQQALAFASNPIVFQDNAGDARVIGFDALVTVQPIEGLTLSLNGGYVDTKFTDIADTSGPFMDNRLLSSKSIGDQLDLVPNFTISGSIDYRFTVIESLPSFVRVDVNYQDEMTFTDRNNSLFGLDEVTSSDPLTFVNARLGIEGSNWEVSIFARNLTNESGHIDPFGGGLSGIVIPRPRQLGGTFKVSL